MDKTKNVIMEAVGAASMCWEQTPLGEFDSKKAGEVAGKLYNDLFPFADKETDLPFGFAIEALKAGQMVRRAGWNGKGMFLFMRPEDTLTTGIIAKVKSLPQSVKDWIDREVDDKDNPGESGLNPVKFTAYICMKAADGSIVNGWLASQTDILSEDWEIIS